MQGDVVFGVEAKDVPVRKYPKPPRPVFTDWGGINPLTWTAYEVIVSDTVKVVLVSTASGTIKLEGRQAAHFLRILGDYRAAEFEDDGDS